jgi:probable rRNA maturation factor
MEIAVENLQKVFLNLPRITRVTKTILRHEKVRKAEICVVFVSSQKIKSLNKKFLRGDYATDVLAFDFREGGACRGLKGRREGLIGDIIVSVGTAARHARIYQTSLEREIVLCVIHGILHLLGFDDHSLQDVKRMRDKERQILQYVTPLITKILSRAKP